MEQSQTDIFNVLIEENSRLLEQGIRLIAAIPESTYRNNTHEHYKSGVGKHFRHVLDFYSRFLAGGTNTIDYDKRRRDPRVESDPEYACDAARAVVANLQGLQRAEVGGDVSVRVETCAVDGIGLVTGSSVERELAYLASHTVHHFAIIKIVLGIQGVKADPEFGIAPSTLRHEQSLRGG